jgi:nucleoside-diphosphate-sugar epimerase
MKVLITGGAGYLGTVLTEEILNRFPYAKVIVYDNLMYKQDGLFSFFKYPKDRFEFVYGDVRDKDSLLEQLQKLDKNNDYVIPLAAIVGFPACARDEKLATAVNFEHVKYIVQSTKCRIIYPNTNSGYGVSDGEAHCTEETPLAPISVYGRTKCDAEEWVLGAGHTSLRLATVFGTSYRFRKDLLVNDFVLRAVTDSCITLFESSFKRNFIHIRDVAHAFIHMFGHRSHPNTEGTTIFIDDDNNPFNPYGQSYNVGLSSANFSKFELCEKIKEHVPGFVITTSEINSDPDKRNYIVSNDKLEATGWEARVDIDKGIQELVRAYQVFSKANVKHTNL